jgi:hypothetical protein
MTKKVLENVFFRYQKSIKFATQRNNVIENISYLKRSVEHD